MESKKYPPLFFKKLYFKRWKIETFYDEFKNKLKIEHFSGYSYQSIMQDFFVNPLLHELLLNIFGSGADERYVRDFTYYTQRGLYSFDKTNLNNFTDNRYHLVSSPVNPLKIIDLPSDILGILMQTKFEDHIDLIKELDTSGIK